jgi:hypothetical protein
MQGTSSCTCGTNAVKALNPLTDMFFMSSSPTVTLPATSCASQGQNRFHEHT